MPWTAIDRMPSLMKATLSLLDSQAKPLAGPVSVACHPVREPPLPAIKASRRAWMLPCGMAHSIVRCHGLAVANDRVAARGVG